MQYQEEVDFLKEKGLLKGDNTTFEITGDFGKINLAELLNEYAQRYNEEHDQGVWGRKDY